MPSAFATARVKQHADHRPRDNTAIDLTPLPEMVGYALRRAQVAAFRSFTRAFAEYDIRPAQLGLLSVIERNPGLKQSEIGAALGIKRTNLVPLLDELEARGLVDRAKAASDRRSHALRLTDDGAHLLVALRLREAVHEKRATAALGKAGREQLLDLLAVVEQAYSTDEDGVGA